MRNLSVNPCFEITGQPLSELVAFSIAPYDATAVQQNSFFVNDVPQDLRLLANKETFTSILSKILRITALYGKDSCIRISAKSYHDILLIHIKISDSLNAMSVMPQLESLRLQAKKLAGFLDITSVRSKVTTISFTLLNSNSSNLISNGWKMYSETAA